MAQTSPKPEFGIGTAGWSYRHRRGVFYPESVPQREWLTYYAQQLDTGAYPDDVLADWAKWLAGRLAEGRNVYAYFNNDIGAHAPRDAQRPRGMPASVTG